MKSHRSEGVICLDGPRGLVYQIGIIACTVYKDESFRYEFTPNWQVIDLLEPPDFQGVPGFDLNARKEVYVRENITPTFISERAPSENRENLWQLLDDVGLDYLDKVEWLVRTNTRYIGDKLYVCAVESNGAKCESAISESIASEPATSNTAISNAAASNNEISAEITEIVGVTQNSMAAELAILKRLCAGKPLMLKGQTLNSEARRALHVTLRALLEKTFAYREVKRKEGVQRAAKQGRGAGRKRKAIDMLVLAETLEMYEAGTLDAPAATKRLGISKATFYRRLKERREIKKANSI
jgi:hypothetical protein